MSVLAGKAYQYDYPRPMVTVDVVVFTVVDSGLEVLLIERGGEPFAGRWALPGGFIEIEEDLEAAARRELAEETGVEGLFMEQLFTFGVPGRDPRGRTISVGYYALSPASRKSEAVGEDDAVRASWFVIGELPELAFDHREIVESGLDRLAGKVRYTTAGFKMLEEMFTLSQLQHVYESVWGRELDRRNFRKWILGRNIIEPTGDQVKSGRCRPAQLYRLIENYKPMDGLLVFD